MGLVAAPNRNEAAARQIFRRRRRTCHRLTLFLLKGEPKNQINKNFTAMSRHMRQSADNRFIPITSVASGKGREVRRDVYYYTNQIVNVTFVGDPEGSKWVLVDTGMPKSSSKIISAAEERFGIGSAPAAIILTHGHFDHVGSLVNLVKEWEVPVYAHPLEFPYLTGRQSYPEPDSSAEGGLLGKLSSFYPHQPIDIENMLHPLTANGIVPELPGWKWIHTPGHSPGHVSLYRASDRTLIAGDAFTTVRQDSLYNVLLQKAEINGPPRYFTTDWDAAWESVHKLEQLEPDLVVPGHGAAMQGEPLRVGLNRLVREFEELAVPDHGRYV